MQRRRVTSCFVLVMMMGLPGWFGCAETKPPAATESVQAADLRDIDRLVAEVNERPHNPWSKRAYDRRDRAMALLAEKTAALLARDGVGAGEQALTGSWDEAAAARRAALSDLHAAAGRRDLRAITASHRRLTHDGG